MPALARIARGHTEAMSIGGADAARADDARGAGIRSAGTRPAGVRPSSAVAAEPTITGASVSTCPGARAAGQGLPRPCVDTFPASAYGVDTRGRAKRAACTPGPTRCSTRRPTKRKFVCNDAAGQDNKPAAKCLRRSCFSAFCQFHVCCCSLPLRLPAAIRLRSQRKATSPDAQHVADGTPLRADKVPAWR